MEGRARCTTFHELHDYIGDRNIRPLGWNNTHVIRKDEDILAIMVHHREIVQLRDDGCGGTAIRVRHAGFPTHLTKNRINLFVPAHWWCERKGTLLVMRYSGPVFNSSLREDIHADIWSSWMVDTDNAQIPRVRDWPVK